MFKTPLPTNTMSNSAQLKEKLLQVLALNLYTTLTPPQIFSTYNELILFFNNYTSTLSEIEYYDLIELQFQLALIMGKDEIAKTLLDRINDKFGGWESERLAILKIRYLEATKGVNAAMEFIETRTSKVELKVLKAKIHLAKRNGASMEEYVILLKGLLMFDPLDIETLAELSQCYYDLGHYSKAIFTLEEVLLVQPYNYVVFAKLGEWYHVSYLSDEKTKTSKDANDLESLRSSLKHFLRSVELCSNFVRGWSGVYVITKLLSSKESDTKMTVKYKKLNETSKKQLQLIADQNDSTKENIVFAKKVLAL